MKRVEAAALAGDLTLANQSEDLLNPACDLALEKSAVTDFGTFGGYFLKLIKSSISNHNSAAKSAFANLGQQDTRDSLKSPVTITAILHARHHG